jgi:hypothetical protein
VNVNGHRFASLVALGLSALAAGCHDPDRYLLQPGRAEEFIQVEPVNASLPADGVSRLVLTATLAERTATTNRKVMFKTTLGTLIAGTQKGTSVTIDADASGRASAELQSETTIGTARIEVGAGPAPDQITLVRVVNVPFVALPPDSAFSLIATPTSIAADGFSRAVIRAELRPVPGSTQRSVVFKAFSTGLLFAATESAGSLEKTVSANSDGVAITELQSSRNLETARVQATALGVTREVQVTFTAANPGDIIRLSASAPSVPADGASIVRIIATVAAGLPQSRRTVQFTTSFGFFASGTKTIEATADGANRAIVDLRTEQTTGIANVRGTLAQDGVSDAVTVTFTPALPDRIFVRADSGRISATGSTVVTAQLLRDVGKPSDRTIVTYSAVTAAGTPVGIFSNVTLANAEGESRATFTPGPTAAPGLVTIRAAVGGTIVGTTTIEITP